jgi:hypothetical protein
MFMLSSSLFDMIQAKNLSLVFVKEKLDEDEQVEIAVLKKEVNVDDYDFVELEEAPENPKLIEKGSNQILNETLIPEPSIEKINTMGETADFDKFKMTPKFMEEQNGPKEELNENAIHGLPK